MFESKLIGMAPSSRLGVIRVVVVLCALLEVVLNDFTVLAYASAPWFEATGFLRLLGPLRPQLFFNPLYTFIFKASLIAFLLSAMAGFFTNVSLLLSTLLYGIYLGLLRSGTCSLDSGFLPLYLMFILSWIPSGEAFSIDQRFRKEYAHLTLEDRPSVSMGWSVFLVRVVIAFSFFLSGVSKLQNTGLGWIRPWRFQQAILEDSLTFLHADWIPQILSTPAGVWGLLACLYMGCELLFPAILVFRNLQVFFLLMVVATRSFVLFPQNIIFHDLILLQFAFYDWDRILPIHTVSGQDRRQRKPLFSFRK